jgi:hypothetical protein
MNENEGTNGEGLANTRCGRTRKRRGKTNETLRTPEQAHNRDDDKAEVVWNDGEVDELGRDEDAPVAKKSWRVCLLGCISRLG